MVIGLDRTLRLVGAVPTYALTDYEKTVTVEHVCGIAVRNATIVEVSRHYGLTIATCEPADPQSKGGVEATVRVAKADRAAGERYRCCPIGETLVVRIGANIVAPRCHERRRLGRGRSPEGAV